MDLGFEYYVKARLTGNPDYIKLKDHYTDSELNELERELLLNIYIPTSTCIPLNTKIFELIHYRIKDKPEMIRKMYRTLALITYAREYTYFSELLKKHVPDEYLQVYQQFFEIFPVARVRLLKYSEKGHWFKNPVRSKKSKKKCYI